MEIVVRNLHEFKEYIIYFCFEKRLGREERLMTGNRVEGRMVLSTDLKDKDKWVESEFFFLSPNEEEIG